MQKWVVDNTDRIVATIVSETGKTHDDALLNEIVYGSAAFGFWAKHAAGYLADEKVRSANPLVAGRKLVVRYRPLGVIGVIGPWNYPLTNSFGDCIPALAAGNAVVLKPSEVTPLTSQVLAEGMRACGLPEDVLLIATGAGETGAALVDEADMIMFTGSTRTGKRIMERAARTLTPVSLELGGKDPMIVLADADLERAIERRGVLLDAERRPDLHLGRARLRRGADLRRVRRRARAQGRRAAPGRLVRAGQHGHRRGHVRPAARGRRPPRAGGARRRRPRPDRRLRPRRRAAGSTSRPCSSTSTTRWRR